MGEAMVGGRLGSRVRLGAFGVAVALMGCVTATQASEIGNFKLLRFDGANVRWRGTNPNQAPRVSYGIVTETREVLGARNCGALTSLDKLATTSLLREEAIREEIKSAFAMWEDVADIDFRTAETPLNAEILIGAQLEPFGWAYADVIYDVGSSDRPKAILQSVICLNPLRRWKIGFDGDLKSYDLRYTIAHEIGHAIGLDHPATGGQIMGYRYEEQHRDLQPGDIAGAALLYGRRKVLPVMAAGRTTRALPQAR